LHPGTERNLEGKWTTAMRIEQKQKNEFDKALIPIQM
jgi:hypothetical protein